MEFIHFLGAINSQSIEGISNINGTSGQNITITWLLNNIKNSIVLGLYVNDSSTANKIASFTSTNIKTNEQISFNPSEFDVTKRAKLYYSYIGDDQGNKTGKVTLDIFNLKLIDGNRYILELMLNPENIFTTILNINCK